MDSSAVYPLIENESEKNRIRLISNILFMKFQYLKFEKRINL